MDGFKVFLISFCIMTSIGFAKPWEKGGMNDPTFFNLHTKKYSDLSKEGYLPFIPVTSTHWLHKEGGLSNRYQESQKTGYKLLSKEEVFKTKDISKLSPAEKYDLLRGDYTFSMTRQEMIAMKNTKNPWEGHCHGWGVVSLVYDIPSNTKVLKNKDGLEIPFEPQDIVAILSYFEGMLQTPWDFWVIDHKLPSYIEKMKDKPKKNQVEEMLSSIHSKELLSRIKKSKNLKATLKSETKKYKLGFYTPYVGVINRELKHQDNDPNPGAVHLILTNSFGHKEPSKRRGMIADTDPFKPVWNRPLYGYSFKELERRKDAKKTEIDIEMIVSFVKELEIPMPGEIKRKPSIQKKKMNYTIELNPKGEIIGGKWDQKSDRFDFFWSPFFNQMKDYSNDKFYNKVLLERLARRML